MATLVAVVIAAQSAAADAPAPQPSLGGNVAPNFPAAPPGRVAVVRSGLPYRGVIPLVVRNGSTASVDRVKVSVTARGRGGRVVARGSTRDLVPALIRPNEIAIGGVRLRRPVGADSRFGFTVSSRRRRSGVSAPALAITNTALSGPMVGAVAQRLTGELQATGRTKVRGPVVVSALCLDEASHPVLTASASGARRGVSGGSSAPFTIEFPELCPAYLVGARSRDAA